MLNQKVDFAKLDQGRSAPRAGVGSSPSAGVGGLINRLSTNFGYTQMLSSISSASGKSIICP